MAKKSEKEIAPAAPHEAKDGSDKDWEADDAVRTLEKAHEIKANPEMMSRVKKRAGRKLAALKGLSADLDGIDDKPRSVEDLKKIRNAKFMEK